MPGLAGGRGFIDSNIILYALSDDAARSVRAREILVGGGIISVQVLNEVANVCARNLRLAIDQIDHLLASVRSFATVQPVTLATHDLGLWVARRYGFAIHDAMLIGAALEHGCDIFWTEEMQDGQVIDDRLTVRNPFAG
jgi:predicted nucleic acid-binding protein